MANSLSGVKTFMTAVIGSKPWKLDPIVIPKPWSEDEWNLSEHGGVGAQLCFAIMWDNGVVKPHPPLVRAMKAVKAALERAGHTGAFPLLHLPIFKHDHPVIDWEPHRHLEIYKNAVFLSFHSTILVVPLRLFRRLYLLPTVDTIIKRNALNLENH